MPERESVGPVECAGTGGLPFRLVLRLVDGSTHVLEVELGECLQSTLDGVYYGVLSTVLPRQIVGSPR